ncbi:MAG: hypoxanthine phosphoribosyltransferase [Acholeplasmataceae bacterium]
MKQDIKEVLVTEEQIQELCVKLGRKLTLDYKDKERPILLGLLKGCVPFMSDLMKHIDIPIEVEFMDVKSYHGGISSSGDIKIRMDINTSVSNRDIIICEDIVDTGKTLDTVVRLLKHRGANSVEVVTLLDKPGGRLIPFTPKYIGITIPKVFVVGYGLDYNEYYRNLPYVGVLKESV